VPTFEATVRFWRDFERLIPDQQLAFLTAVSKLVADLKSGTIRSGLRVKGVQGHEGVFEISWAPDGRATFTYGEPVIKGEPHVVWRRCGSHDIFNNP
jgi:hypothetical protein